MTDYPTLIEKSIFFSISSKAANSHLSTKDTGTAPIFTWLARQRYVVQPVPLLHHDSPRPQNLKKPIPPLSRLHNVPLSVALFTPFSKRHGEDSQSAAIATRTSNHSCQPCAFELMNNWWSLSEYSFTVLPKRFMTLPFSGFPITAALPPMKTRTLPPAWQSKKTNTIFIL